MPFQAHKQRNAVVKGEGGAVGLTKNPAALRRWMVAGPKIAQMVEEFKEVIYDNKPAIESAFAKDVVNLVSSFKELGSPLKEVGEDLIALHTKDIMNEEVVRTLRTVRQPGEQQFKTFLKERLEDKTSPQEEQSSYI